ncbi:MAG: transposase [Aggregatilineales bacterium]
MSLEAVTDATVAASDGSAFATPGPVWHKQAKAAGIVPEGLHGLDTAADWIQSLLRTLLLDAGYDDGDLIADCAQHSIEVLAPLSKPVGKSTPQDRRDRAAYLAAPTGKARYRLRGCSIEPFFATIKDFFHLDPLPVQGKIKAEALILLALYVWNLIVLFNFVHDHPLGAVKPVLDLL